MELETMSIGNIDYPARVTEEVEKRLAVQQKIPASEAGSDPPRWFAHAHEYEYEYERRDAHAASPAR